MASPTRKITQVRLATVSNNKKHLWSSTPSIAFGTAPVRKTDSYRAVAVDICWTTHTKGNYHYYLQLKFNVLRENIPSYVVTGAARGLGLEFVNQLSRQSDSVVFALVRSKKTADKVFALGRSNVHMLEADITDVNALKIAAKEVSKVTDGTLDVLINNAVFFDEERNHLNLDEYPEGREDLLEEDLRKNFNVNVIGVVHTTNVFLPLLRSPSKTSLKKVITLTTGLADLDFTLSTSYSLLCPYSISKAALNLVVAKYAVEYKNKANSASNSGAGIVFLALGPGLVSTKEQLSEPTVEDIKKFEAMVTSFRIPYPDFPGPITPEESVKALLKVIDNATMEDTGAFISHKGNKEWL